MTEIDTYERECLSHWTEAKESTENVVEEVSNRMREFLDEQHAYLKASDDQLILHLKEARKLAQELDDRKKELKSAMFDNKLASFNAFPSMGETCLGELAFAHVQLPLKKLDIASTELKLIDFRADYDFLLPLEHGQRIVLFNRYLEGDEFEKCFTQMSCFDRLGRLTGINSVEHHVKRGNVAQCGPSAFVVCHYWHSPELSVYDSELKCLRNVRCKNFSHICCNSKFVFGLWDTSETSDEYEPYQDDDDDEDDDNVKIQVLHLDTLSEAFGLRVPEKYTMERIMADEHHVVALSHLSDEPDESRRWFMSIFELSGKESCDHQFFLAERHIDLTIQAHFTPEMSLLDGWLMLPLQNELVWIDKKGKRSETTTRLDTSNVTDIFSSDMSLLFVLRDKKLLLK